MASLPTTPSQLDGKHSSDIMALIQGRLPTMDGILQIRAVPRVVIYIMVLLLAIGCPTHSYAKQEPPAWPKWRFANLNVEQGLPDGRVWSITQDRYGFVWFGTYDGLTRFDGFEFKTYRPDPLQPNSACALQIQVLLTDQTGIVWFGSLQEGLGRFDPVQERFTCYRYNPQDPEGISGPAILSLLETEDGDLWIGTSQGLDRFDRETGRFVHYQPDTGDSYGSYNEVILSIYQDQSGILWTGTYGGGLRSLDVETGDWRFFRHDQEHPQSLSSDLVMSVRGDREGDLWIGTWGGGLNHLDRETGDFTSYRYDPEHPDSLSSDTIMAVHIDRAGVLWVGTQGGGLNRLDRETGTFFHYRHDPNDANSLAHNHVTTIYEDASGTLWIGTDGGGVSRLDPSQKPFQTYRLRLDSASVTQSQDVRAIYEDPDGVLWLGLYGAGLVRLDRNSGEIRQYVSDPRDPTSLGHNDVSAILRDRNGALWIGTLGGGLNRFEPDTGTFVRYQHDPANPHSLSLNDVTVLFEDQAGALWVGTSGAALNRMDPASERFTRFAYDPQDPQSLSRGWVISLEEDNAGRLWIGTTGGVLDRFEPQTETFVHYQPDPVGPYSAHDRVSAVAQDPMGYLWLGTEAGGLVRFDPDTGDFAAHTPPAGMSWNQIQGIVAVDAPSVDGEVVLWLSTNRGLARYEPGTGSVRIYDASDGLPAIAFNQGSTHQGPDGELLLGSVGGLVSFYPEEIQDDRRIPAVFITELQVNNQPVAVGKDSVLDRSIIETDAMTLSPQYRNVSFEFAALNYSAPEKGRYRYRLEGLDEDWTEVPSTRRFASYTNLEPGSYIFRVIGSNADGQWNQEGDSLAFTILPHWWETTWFWGGLLLVVAGLVFAGYQYRMYALRQRAEVLETTVSKRTQELHESREKYRSLVEQISEVIYSMDPDGRLTYVSPAVNSLLGYQASEMIDRLFDEFIHPEDLEQVRNRFTNLTTGYSTGSAEYRLLTKSGDARWVRTSSQTIWDGKQVAGLRGVLVDIHDHKQVEHQLEQAAAAAEREHLARDLHDAVTQNLFTAAVIADVLPDLWERHPEEARRALLDLRQLTQGSLAEMRTMLLALRPDALTNKSLGELLRELAEAMQSRTRIPVTSTIAGDCRMSLEVKTSLYRIAQEALNNAIKHARCNQVWIGATCEGRCVKIYVRDDGRGFDPTGVKSSRMGLKIMHERAEAVRARLEIDTNPGEGTLIQVVWEADELPVSGQ